MAYTTIDKPTDYFRTKTYTGNGGTQSITFDESDNMQPDWIWLKDRDNAYSHLLVDSIRGNTKTLNSNETSAEGTASDRVTSFDSNGFSLGSYIGSNKSSSNVVSWNWYTGATASSNTDGSITSSVSANTTAGFSIVSYTGTASAGATVGHGLGVKPDMIITKARAIADNWGVYHKSLGATKGLYLNTTNAEITSSAYYNNTEPTSTLVTLGDNEATNDNDTMIMYAFAEKKGYSKFSSYVGNGSSDGTFVYTGFKPAFVLTKSTSNAVNWQMQDNKTAPHNLMVNKLFANTSATQDTGSENTVDFLSNGFKPRGTGSSENINGNGYSYIYMAFAENPFVTSTGIPACAR